MVSVQERTMNKSKLIPGHKYLRRHTVPTKCGPVEVEGWIKCTEITEKGAKFSREYSEGPDLTDEQIRKELREGY